MRTPNILYYARLEYDKTSGKTPKYTVTAQAGYYPPMEQLKGRNGKISMYLLDSKDSGAKKDNAPAMRLQASGNLNFSGLKDYFEGGKLSGYAYGYPLSKPTYSAKERVNPFYDYREDGFLFLVHQDEAALTEAERLRPSYFELIVLEGGKVMISAWCKMLVMGGFDEALMQVRKQAQEM